ncbi:SAM-dependent methyltransferase [Thermomonospora cellulosilytica]|uniref:S-adenosyl methyltransferase n=1 Tax=Thermomonospora cellulosilytica TaxID=1411118 RepID=A0A7W3R7G3_9ACTN|nr:SAM-dependent methyltransferase [Thermomonospora cellulosilytica]MBA9002310.1 hypothetical protein [Thermomonospora cellulosilytica]
MADDVIPDIPTDVPTSARLYGWTLGGKDNFEVDRKFGLASIPHFPEIVDIARQNRLFLYRVVRYLAREAGIRQFVDMGCGLPTDQNVHQVAQRFAPDARVLYVDIDPIVLAHARALLAGDGSTVVITADMRDPQAVLDHPDTKRLIDFDEPLAVLYLSVGHHLLDADDPRRVLHHVIDRAVPGSHLAFTQIVSSDPERRAQMDAVANAAGMPWKTRSTAEVDALLEGLEPVEPGLGDINDWRPDPDQPPLAPVPEELKQYVGASKLRNDLHEYGGLLRKP